MAGVPNIEEMLGFLRFIADRVANITTPLDGVTDTLETRKGIHTYLTGVIDEVSRIRNNGRRNLEMPLTGGGSSED